VSIEYQEPRAKNQESRLDENSEGTQESNSQFSTTSVRLK